MSSLFIVLSFCLLVLTASAALFAALSTDQRTLGDKLEDLAVQGRAAQGFFQRRRGQSDGFGRMLLQWASRRVPSSKVESPKGEKLAQTLAQAGYSQSSALRVFRTARCVSSAVGTGVALLAAVLWPAPPGSAMVWIIGGASLGAFLPGYYLGRRARLRQRSIARDLSEVLDLLVVCVEAGLGLHEAIRVVGAEVERQGRAIGRELSQVSGEMAAGKSLGQALRSFADRTAVEDVKPLAATLIQSEQLGAQIAPALRASSDQLRSRRRLRAEEEAQKTVIKILFPLVLFILPAMMIVIVGPAIVQILRTFKG